MLWLTVDSKIFKNMVVLSLIPNYKTITNKKYVNIPKINRNLPTIKQQHLQLNLPRLPIKLATTTNPQLFPLQTNPPKITYPNNS
jgi:hypothetical protein